MAAIPPDRRPDVLAELLDALRRCQGVGELPDPDVLPLAGQDTWHPSEAQAVERLEAIRAHLDDALTALDTLEMLDCQEGCRGR